MRINNFAPQQKVGFKAQQPMPRNVDTQAEMLGIMAEYGEPLSRSFAKRMIAGSLESGIENAVTGSNPNLTIGQAVRGYNLAQNLQTSANMDMYNLAVPKIVVNADNTLRTSLSLLR